MEPRGTSARSGRHPTDHLGVRSFGNGKIGREIITLTQQNRASSKTGERDGSPITEEMVTAGVEILRGYDLDGDAPRDVARWVFSAMQQARHLPRRPTHRPS